MVLTSEGRTFCPEALRTVEQALLAEEKTKACIALNSGRLMVGHSTYLPPKLLALVLALRFDKPQNVRVEHLPGVTAQLIERVAEGTLHGAFTELSILRPVLLFRQIMEEPVVVCLPKSHALATKPTLRPQDLDGVPIIAVSRESSPAQHVEIEDYFEQFGTKLNVVADAFGPPEALTMVEQGVGACFIEASAARSGLAVMKPLFIPKLTRKSGIYVREDNRHPALEEYVHMAIQRIEGRHRQTSSQPQKAGVQTEIHEALK